MHSFITSLLRITLASLRPFPVCSTSSALAALAGCSLAVSALAADPTEFESIFDGHSFQGWLGQDMSFWTIEDGAITGTISPQHAPRMNQYLVWQRDLVQDFELKLEFRFTACSAKSENGGFQFRSRRLPNGDVAGYQVDNNFGTPWKVRLYDEHGRHDLALEGEKTVFDPSGQKQTVKLALEPGASNFRLDDWHEYHLLAQGQHLALRINGKLVAEATDQDPASFEPAGVLALQLHTGPPMKVQFRAIRFKRLPPAQELSPRERLLLGAALHWQFGNRISSYQPPLKAVGQITPELAADGPGARAGAKVSRLEQACFHSDMALNDSKTWNLTGQAATLFVRARIREGRGPVPLLTKGSQRENVNVALLGVSTNPGAASDIGFQIATDTGAFLVTCPHASAADNSWHSWIGRYDGRAIQILRDGQVMAQKPASGSLRSNPEPLLVGGQADNGKGITSFNGELEEAALWDRALTDDELRTLARREGK